MVETRNIRHVIYITGRGVLSKIAYVMPIVTPAVEQTLLEFTIVLKL